MHQNYTNKYLSISEGWLFVLRCLDVNVWPLPPESLALCTLCSTSWKPTVCLQCCCHGEHQLVPPAGRGCNMVEASVSVKSGFSSHGYQVAQVPCLPSKKQRGDGERRRRGGIPLLRVVTKSTNLCWTARSWGERPLSCLTVTSLCQYPEAADLLTEDVRTTDHTTHPFIYCVLDCEK